MTTPSSSSTIPIPFLWRRLHSLAGLWLTLYMIIHLFTNAQAALPFGDDGKGFIHAVNAIHDLPFLPVIEIVILGIPIIIHTIWGIKYARQASPNSYGYNPSTPHLSTFSRNKAYTWQRITAYLLVLGIFGHIIHMRFVNQPTSISSGNEHVYMIPVTPDEGLYTLAPRINAAIVTKNEVETFPQLKSLQQYSLKKGEVIVAAENFGTVELLMLRDTFKSPLMLTLYTLFVLTACFHGFNGLWTWMITWGITLSENSQRLMRYFSNLIMCLVAFLGLSAIWFTYWINLRN